MLSRGVKPARAGTRRRNPAESEARSSVVIPGVSSNGEARWVENRPCGRGRRKAPTVDEGSLAYDGGMENFWLAAAWSILPTIGVSAVFFMVIRGILRFDRTERRVHAQIEAEERAARGLPPRP